MKKGFSLVELSIVLIIIGLLIAAVTGGNKLIENAKLQKVVRELQAMQIAFFAFKLTHDDALPGDFRNAEVLWNNDCENDDTKGTANDSCAGDGDGAIEITGGAPSTNSASDYHVASLQESYRATYHLLLTGLLNANLTNDTSDTSDTLVPGTNIPTSSWPHTGISIQTAGSKTMVLLGRASVAAAAGKNWNDVEVFTPSQAFLIDKKIDDGKPEQGSYYSYLRDNTSAGSLEFEGDAAGGTGCVLTGTFPDKKYNVAATTVECGGAFVLE